MINILTTVRNPARHQHVLGTWSRSQQRLREPGLSLLLMLVIAIFVAGPPASMHVLPIAVSMLLDCAVIVVVAITSPNSKAQSIIIGAVVVDAISWYVCDGRPRSRRHKYLLEYCTYFCDGIPSGDAVGFPTLTTTGFGDITPVNPLVRSAANLESVVRALVPATLLARLVVRYLS